MPEKKKKKRRKFSFRRSLLYMATYILITCSVAFVVVTTNKKTFSSNSPMLLQEEENSTAIGLLASNLMGLEDISIDLTASLTNDEHSLSFNANGDIIIHEEFSGVDANITTTIIYDDITYSVQITYLNNNLYMLINSRAYSLNTPTFISGVMEILTLSGIDMGLSSGDEQAASFDMSMINSLNDKIQEEVLDNGVKLLFSVVEGLDLEIYTDASYNLKSVELNNYMIADNIVNVDLQVLNTNSMVEIYAPNCQTLDVTNVVDIVKALANSVMHNGVTINGKIAKDNKSVFDFACKIDNDDTFKAQLQTNLLNNNISLYYEDGSFYFNTEMFKGVFNVDEYQKYIDVISSFVAVPEVTVQDVTEIVENVKQVNLNHITSIYSYNDLVIIYFEDNSHIDILLENGSVDEIKVYYNNYKLQFDFDYNSDYSVVVPNYDYVNFADLLPLINPIKNIVENGELNVKANLHYEDINFNCNVLANFDESRVHFDTVILDTPIVLDYFDNNIYLVIGDYKIKSSTNDFKNILNYLLGKYGNQVKELADNVSVLPKDYLKLNIVDNCYQFTFGDIVISATMQNAVFKNITLTYGDVSGALEFVDTPVTFTEINTQEYSQHDITLNAIQTLYEKITAQQYDVNLNFELDGTTYFAHIMLDLTEGIHAKIETNLYGYDISVILQNNILYVNVDSIKISASITEIPQLLEQLVELLNNENVEQQGKAIGASMSLTQDNTQLIDLVNSIKNITIADILKSIEISQISGEDNQLTIQIKDFMGLKEVLQLEEDIKITVAFEDSFIKQIDVQVDQIQIAATLNEIPQNFAVEKVTIEEQKEYNGHINELVELVKCVKKSYESNYINANLYLTYKGKTYTIYLNLDKTEQIRVYAYTVIENKRIEIYYQNNTVYVSALEHKIKFDLSEIDNLTDLIKNAFSIDLDQELQQQINNVNTDDLLDMIKGVYTQNNETVIELTNKQYVIMRATNNKISNIQFISDVFNVSCNVFYPTLNTLPAFSEQEAQKYFNVMAFANNMFEYILNKEYVVDINVVYKEYNINGYIEYANNNLYGELNTVLYGKSINLVLSNNDIYLTAGAIKLHFDLNDIDELLNYLESKFGITVPQLNLETSNSLTKEDIIVLLSQITITRDNNVIYVSYNNASGIITTNNDMLQSVAVGYENLSAIITLVNKREHITQFVGYSDVMDITSTIDAVISTIENKTISGNLALAFELNGELQNFTINYGIDLSSDNIQGYLNTTIKGVNLDIVVKNDTIYLNIAGVKTNLKFDQINEVVDWLKNEFELDIPQINFDEKINDLTDVSIDDISLDILRELTITNTQINIVVNDYKLTLNYTDTIDSVIFEYDSTNVTLNITNCTEINMPIVIESEYVNFARITQLTSYVKNIIESKQVEFEVSVVLNNTEYVAIVKIDFNNNLQVQVNTTIMGLTINAIIQDNNVYCDVNGFKFYDELKNIQHLIDEITRIAEIDLSNDTIDSITNTFKTTSIENIINSLDMAISTPTDNQFVFALNTLLDLNEILNCTQLAKITFTTTQQDISGLNVKFADYSANILLHNTFDIDVLTNEQIREYKLQLVDLLPITEAIKNTLGNMSIRGNIDLYFDYASESNLVNIDYGIRYNDNQLSGYIETQFKGVSLGIVFKNNTMYIDVAGLKLYLQFNQINELITLLNDNYGLNLPAIDINEFNIDNISLENLSLDFLENISVSETNLLAVLTNGLTIKVQYSEEVNLVEFEKGSTKASIYCLNYNNFDLPAIVDSAYSPYTVVTDAIDSVMNTLAEKQFNVNAIAKVYDNSNLQYTGNIDLAIDAKEQVNLYGHGEVTGKGKNYDVILAFQNDYLFVNYNGLKIKAQQQTLKELLVIALEALGIDPATIPWLESVSESMELDMGNLSSIIPAIDLGNPLNMLSMIKSINLNDNTFTLVLNGASISTAENPLDMTIELSLENNKITHLNLTNIYTGVANGEYFNLYIDFKTFTSVPVVAESNKYIDLSNSSHLIKAFINTSNLNDYYITGKVNLGLIGIDKAVTIGVDARIQLDENNKPTIGIKVTSYPLIGLVNGSNTNGVGSLLDKRYRTISIMLKDNYAYLRTTDDDWRYIFTHYDEYTRVTKIPVSYLLSNIEYYMQWLLGFTDSIQSKINEAIEISRNSTDETDMGNIILKYEIANGRHEIDINLAEIAHNDDIGTMKIGLSIKNDASTQNKDYIYGLDMWLELLDGVITLNTDDANKLYLTNIGSVVDMGEINTFINNYAFNEDGEYSKTGSNSYSQSNTNTVTITYNNNGGNGATSVSGIVASNLTLSTPTKISDNGITRTTYTFKGWYTSSDFAENTKYTRTSFPRNNITLYAKWEYQGVQTYRTTTFNDTLKSYNYTANLLEGALLTYPTTYTKGMTYIVDNNVTKTTYTFIGWYLGDVEYNNTVVGNQNITLTAKWSSVTEYYYSANFVDTLKSYNYTANILEGALLTYPTTYTKGMTYIVDNNVTKTTYTFIGWYLGDVEYTNSTMLSQNIILTAKWNSVTENYYTVNFVTNSSQSVASVTKLKNESITLQTLNTYEQTVANTTTTYAFAGWFTTNNFEGGSNVAGQYVITNNTTLYAKWDIIKQETCHNITLKYHDTVLYTSTLVEGKSYTPNSLANYDSSVQWYANWSANGGFSNQVTSFVMGTSDITLYARKKYTITYNSNGGTGVASASYYEGENITTPSPTKANTGIYHEYLWREVKYRWTITSYSFAGWYTNSGLTTSFNKVMSASNITVYAKWNENAVEEKVRYATHKDYQSLYL